MEIQNPFQIAWDRTPYLTVTDYLFAKLSAHGSNLALVDSDSGKQWRYSEMRGWCEMCAERLKEIGVTPLSKVAVITSTTGQALFVHFACSIIGCTAVAINGWMTIDEIWSQVDLSESTHCIAEQQFMQKADDVKKKAMLRGGGRIKAVKCIDDVLTTERINGGHHAAVPNTTKPRALKPPNTLVKETSQKNLLSGINNSDSDARSELSSPMSPMGNNAFKPEDSEVDSEVTTGDDNSGFPAPVIPNSAGGTLEKTMIIFFTAGTTGIPKPVEITHRSLIINLQQLSSPIFGPLQQKERFLLPLAISHVFGALSAYYALVCGATIITIPKFTPKGMISVIDQYKINVVHASPPMVQTLAFDPLVEQHSFESLRSVVIGGAPIDPNVASTCRERLQLRDLRQVYGMTELGGIATWSHFECDKLESVGVPLPGMLFKVVNWETKQICQPHQPGQLLVVGPQVMPSYYKNPKATSEIIDSQGFVRTGDAAFYDENGYIYILDRIKDIIKYKGTLVCPSEVELVLRAHPGIDDCAVVGRQDHVAGEVPAAFVVKSVTHPLLSSAEVRQHVAGKIATFKELRGGVFFISEIPRSACGKVLRRHLKMYWDRERSKDAKEGGSQGGGVGGGKSQAVTGKSSSPRREMPRSASRNQINQIRK